MTFAEVQSFLGIKSRKTLLKYIRNGKLTAFKLGGTRWRISRANINAFIEYGNNHENGSNGSNIVNETH